MLKALHWSEHAAEKIIREKGHKECYVLASGITPSGVIHFGNFREIITVTLVAKALMAREKKVRLLLSWDNYDTFRKVPQNIPRQDMLENFLFYPITKIPDPYGKSESYAKHYQDSFEKQIRKLGIDLIFIDQEKKYSRGDYKEQIQLALRSKDQIINILNRHRTTPLPADWLPISLYCAKHHTDRVKNITFDGDATLTYKHLEHDHFGTENLKTTSRVKLLWRVDWPMRWAYEKVDFEAGGKEHSSRGGSFMTGKELVKIFGGEVPVYLQYDFVGIKGLTGKMSSSEGHLVTIDDVLNVYEPEILKWLFVKCKPNFDFSISFDLDVIKIYEDFDRLERLVFQVEGEHSKKREIASKIYEFSQISEMPKIQPFQAPFRHLCNIIQIYNYDLEKTKKYYAPLIKNERDERRYRERSLGALFWIKNYAPEEFKFSLNKEPLPLSVTQIERDVIQRFKEVLREEWNNFKTDEDLHSALYKIIHQFEISPQQIFPIIYKLLINKKKGPKLAGFIHIIGLKKVLQLLSL